LKLFTLTIMKVPDLSVQSLYESVARVAAAVYKQQAVVELRRREASTTIQVNGVIPGFHLDKRLDAFLLKAAGVTAEWVIENMEEEMFRSLLAKHYDIKQEDLEAVTVYYRHMLQLEAPDNSAGRRETKQNRKQKLTQSLYAFLQEHTALNIDGFIKFRIHEYMEELWEIAEYAVDEFLMDRQYQEFISLLQYFVYIQEAKIPLAHLIHKGGNEFALFNKDMEQIETNDDTTVTVEMIEKDINFEDVIVSTLISVSPERIFIHTGDPDVQIIQTITQIFENRVELCSYCRLCQNLDRSAASDYNKG